VPLALCVGGILDSPAGVPPPSTQVRAPSAAGAAAAVITVGVSFRWTRGRGADAGEGAGAVITVGILQTAGGDPAGLYTAWSAAFGDAGIAVVDLRPAPESTAAGSWDPGRADVAALLGDGAAPDASTANSLWYQAVPLFTEGDQSTSAIGIIAVSQAINLQPGPIVRVPNPLPGGWSVLPGSGAVCRQCVDDINPGAVILAQDTALGCIEAAAWQYGARRWVHLQSAAVPPAAFLAAVIPWLAGTTPAAAPPAGVSPWWFVAGTAGVVALAATAGQFGHRKGT
jgi:hypothetical protein